MVVLPLAEIAARPLLGRGIPGSGPFTQHLTLWVGFLGAALAAREGKLLALATGEMLPVGRFRTAARALAAAVGAGASILLARAALDLLRVEREAGTIVAAGVPVWVALLPFPVALAGIAARLAWRTSGGWGGRVLAAAAIAGAIWLGQVLGILEGRPAWPGLTLLIAAAVLGAPIFALLGGAALLLFAGDGVPAAAVPVSTYELVVSPHLPAIPLFTLAGFLLAEGDVSQRLLRVFRAFFGWMPGATAVVCAVICAFFTVFTGGSGVTILALGALLFQALVADRYRERFSLGLLTAAGSLGLLLPPALPMIIYGVVAQQSIEDLFIGGIVPGLLLVALTAAWGVQEGMRRGAHRAPFRLREAGIAAWQAKWELLLPAVVLVAIFGGYATLVETSALAALYAFVLQFFVHRHVGLRRDALRIFRECVILVGGVLIIIGMAKGLAAYLVHAQVPEQMVEWTGGFIHSRWAFLLALNLLLLVVGCLMDIFSAIVVVVPLITPLAASFGVHPVHLGVIFIANLELGYLTPPVGLNLFLASYRFERPLLEVWRAVVPMLLILGGGVLLITYVPGMTLGLLRLLGRG